MLLVQNGSNTSHSQYSIRNGNVAAHNYTLKASTVSKNGKENCPGGKIRWEISRENFRFPQG